MKKILAVLLISLSAWTLPCRAQVVNVSITLSVDELLVSESLTVSWTVGPAPILPTDWVAVYRGTNLPTVITGNLAVAAVHADLPDQQANFTIPEIGIYEVRFVRLEVLNGTNTWVTFGRSDPITVREPTVNLVSVTASPSDLYVSEPLNVTWSTGPVPAGSNDWVAVYRGTNLPNTILGNLSIQSVRATTPTQPATFFLATPDTYEVRYVRDVTLPGGPVTILTLGKSSPVVVGAWPDGFVKLFLSSTDIRATDPLTVSWFTGPTTPPRSGDWVAIFPGTNLPTVVDGNLAGLAVRADVAVQQTTFTPNDVGIFEMRYVRLLSGSQYTTLARVPFRVRSWFENPSQIRNYPSTNQNVIALGDSLTAGNGSTEGEDVFSQVSRRLCCLPIVNAGVSGNTTAEADLRLEADVLSRSPNVVTVMLGGNDALQGVPKAETTANLRRIIDRIQSVGGVVIIVGIQTGTSADNFLVDYRQIASDTASAYVPGALVGIIGNSCRLSDTVHPNDWGYLIMSKRIAPAIGALKSALAPEPFQPAAARLTIQNVSPDQVALEWMLAPKTRYTLEESTGAQATWRPVMMFEGDSAVRCGVVPRTNSMFYRLNLTEAP